MQLEQSGTGRAAIVVGCLLLVVGGSGGGASPREVGPSAMTTGEAALSVTVHDPVTLPPGPALGAGEPAPVVVVAGLGTVVAPVLRAPGSVPGADLPVVALLAYRQAADVMSHAAPACGLRWTLLAAVGAIESDHGRFGGAVLGPDGVSAPLIRGVPLDGTGPVARIGDTDDGRHDGDPVWDRAVGPMQILPSTWSVIGVDGDADGTRSPDDLDDAALAAAVYLCATREDLREPEAMRRALLRYNRSDSYVSAVMALERGFRGGRYALSAVQSSQPSLAVRPVGFEAKLSAPARRGANEPTGGKRRVKLPGAPAQVPGGTVDPPGGEGPPAGGADGLPSQPEPPSDTELPAEPEAPGEPEPLGEPGEAGVPGDDPAVSPVLVTVTESGVLELCGTGFCLTGQPLDVGSSGFLDEVSWMDHDQDGTVETNHEELSGLVGGTVQLLVHKAPAVWLLAGLNGASYRSLAHAPATADPISSPVVPAPSPA